MDPARRLADERLTWVLIAAAAGGTVSALVAARFSVAATSLVGPLAGAALLAAIAWLYRHWRPEPKLAATCAALAQLVLFTAAAGPLSYLAATGALPLRDETLAHLDALVGLNWRAYLAWTDARPMLAAAFRLTYDTLLPQLAAALLILGLGGRDRALRRLVWGVMLSCLATVAITALLPALDCYAHYTIPRSVYAHIGQSGAMDYAADFLGLRDGTMRRIDLGKLQGIITFPSFHAALGVLYLWAFWQNRWARWPGLLVELTMIAGTPIEGGHYFVDVAAGIAVAVASLAAAARIVDGATTRRPEAAPLTAPLAA